MKRIIVTGAILLGMMSCNKEEVGTNSTTNQSNESIIGEWQAYMYYSPYSNEYSPLSEDEETLIFDSNIMCGSGNYWDWQNNPCYEYKRVGKFVHIYFNGSLQEVWNMPIINGELLYVWEWDYEGDIVADTTFFLRK